MCQLFEPDTIALMSIDLLVCSLGWESHRNIMMGIIDVAPYVDVNVKLIAHPVNLKQVLKWLSLRH